MACGVCYSNRGYHGGHVEDDVKRMKSPRRGKTLVGSIEVDTVVGVSRGNGHFRGNDKTAEQITETVANGERHRRHEGSLVRPWRASCLARTLTAERVFSSTMEMRWLLYQCFPGEQELPSRSTGSFLSVII